ncbi:hypothetical protein K443DRAFT_401531 [Laccaria amethystina LaAM-08-1]|uniref:Uncharacterized protein n=1 Tax=Laccaria amethystina LaAM-08-1 TaxID=1095629 RepID=A0A0C9WX62_9AGAR|nr:hypothetical protein K443DRAFT_401531 [Laccaria amethystina LaAM-08-1]
MSYHLVDSEELSVQDSGDICPSSLTRTTISKDEISDYETLLLNNCFFKRSIQAGIETTQVSAALVGRRKHLSSHNVDSSSEETTPTLSWLTWITEASRLPRSQARWFAGARIEPPVILLPRLSHSAGSSLCSMGLLPKDLQQYLRAAPTTSSFTQPSFQLTGSRMSLLSSCREDALRCLANTKQHCAICRSLKFMRTSLSNFPP